MSKFIVSLAFVLAMAPTGSEGFQTYNKEYNSYLPNQVKPPMIYGTVVSTTDRSVTVNSVDDEPITFDIDSRSVMPARLDEGQNVKVEFHMTESDHYLAKRVIPIRPGDMPTKTAMVPPAEKIEQRDWDVDHAPRASNASSNGTATNADYDQTRNGNEQRNVDNALISEKVGSDATINTNHDSHHDMNNDNDRSTAGATNDTDDNLPGTGSQQPLIQALGALALGAGVVLWTMRRRRRSV